VVADTNDAEEERAPVGCGREMTGFRIMPVATMVMPVSIMVMPIATDLKKNRVYNRLNHLIYYTIW
jgi:hypothetical protein